MVTATKTPQIKGALSLADIRAHRGEILNLASIHGARSVRVFGSVVSGDVSETSDVDFLVQWDYERMSPWGGAGFSIALEELLGMPVDVVSEKALHPAIRQRVLSEAVPL